MKNFLKNKFTIQNPVFICLIVSENRMSLQIYPVVKFC